MLGLPWPRRRSASSASTASIAFSTLPPSTMSVPRPAMLVAMVIIFGPAGLRHDLGFARVLLGVEHLVRQVGLGQQAVDDLGVLDRGGAHQHRLAALVALADVLDRGFVLLARGLVDAVELVVAAARLLGGITTVSRP